jgi:predicted nucleotidyltransferase
VKGAYASAVAAVAAWLAVYAEPYAVVGGLAVVLRARPRLTLDIDLLVQVPDPTLDRLLATAAASGLTWDPDALPEPGEEGLLRLRQESPDGALDVDVLYANDPATARVLSRATTVRVLGFDLRVASVEDLVLMKLEANRPQDLEDVLALVDAAGTTLDRAYLQRCAVELDLVDRVRAFTERASQP